MDVIGSTAALGQLLGQIISIWKQVETARNCVKVAPKTLRDTTAQLSSLLNTVEQIQHEPDLCVPEIHTQLKFINDVATELRQILQKMEIRQRQSSLRQGFLALRRGERDEAKLNDVLGRLEKAKAELALRIDVVHVGITRGIAKEIGNFVQEPKVDDNQNMGKRVDRHYLLLEGNNTGEGAYQINGIVGIESSRAATTAMLTQNQALGGGRQKNLIVSGVSSSHLLEAWER